MNNLNPKLHQAITLLVFLIFLTFCNSINAQTPCLEFASGPFINIQTPPCDASCGTPVAPGFQVFENEAYLLNGIAGSEYTVSFCTGYDSLVWDAVITVGVSDDAGGAVPGSEIAFTGGCSLTFTVPSTDTYVIVISGLDNCGGANNPTDNGFIMLDCGPNGAVCDPPPEPCLEFASGPFINIQTPPCDASCGTPVAPGFQVFENEAYLLNGIAGSEYTVSFCTGYDSLVWDAVITVGVSDDAGGAVPGSEIAFTGGCSLTFTVPSTDTYVIVISGLGNCGGANNPTDNGFIMLDCGPNGAVCDPPPEPCLDFASGPFINIQIPPCDASCGTPVAPGFQVFENEAYLLNGIAGSEYTVSFCTGYDSLVWDAVITVGVSDDAGGAVPGSEIAFTGGCSLTFTVPSTDTYVIVISGLGNCGGANNPTDNGFIMLDCGPNGAVCDPPPEPCLDFASGPFINIQIPPCDASCGTPVVPGFEVFENEAYLFDGITGSEYTVSFCTGYDSLVWDAVITVGVSDDAGGAVPGSEIAFTGGCSLTFTVPSTDTYVIVISGLGNCGGANNPTENGMLMLDCGPNGATCDEPTAIIDPDEVENIQVFPNPTMGDTKIELPPGIANNVRLQIVDGTGKLVCEKRFETIQDSSITIEKDWIDEGLFFVNIFHEDKLYSLKLVKLAGN